jgi:CHASE2 domain-containing sensor protein
MKIGHIIAGIIAVSLGIYGVFDEYFVVVEFIKGSIQPLLFLAGIFGILSGILTNKLKIIHVIVGLLLTGLGVYGFMDEYYATLDFFKGAVPPFLLLLGMVAVVGGIRQLE